MLAGMPEVPTDEAALESELHGLLVDSELVRVRIHAVRRGLARIADEAEIRFIDGLLGLGPPADPPSRSSLE